MSGKKLLVRNLDLFYGEFQALKNINFDLGNNEAAAL